MKKPTQNDFDEALECLGIEAERLRLLRDEQGDHTHDERYASLRAVAKWMDSKAGVKPKRLAKTLGKIDDAESALAVAIQAAEEKAMREDLPTQWFHDGLKYLVKLAKASV